MITAAASAALGFVAFAVAAPSARADELAIAAPAAPAYRTQVRPFGLHDLEATSSLGVGVAAGGAFFSGRIRGLAAEVAVDAELAIGHHVKLFASVPLGYALAEDTKGAGFGDLSAGGLAYVDVGRLTLALGGSVAHEGGLPIGVLRHDDVPYGDTWPPRFFADVRLGVDDGFLQLEVDHSTSSDRAMSEAILGGGVPLAPLVWLAGDLGIARYDGPQAHATRVSSDAGVRWQASATARASYAALVTFTNVESSKIVGVALELRADFFALGAGR